MIARHVAPLSSIPNVTLNPYDVNDTPHLLNTSSVESSSLHANATYW